MTTNQKPLANVSFSDLGYKQSHIDAMTKLGPSSGAISHGFVTSLPAAYPGLAATTRQIKSRTEIDALMTQELSKHEDFSGSTLKVMYELQSPDSDGCNWSTDCSLTTGPKTDARHAAPIAGDMVTKARSLFNLPD